MSKIIGVIYKIIIKPTGVYGSESFALAGEARNIL